MLKLKPAKTFRIEGSNHSHYLISYDYSSGRKNRYTTIAYRSSIKHHGFDAFVIGIELPLDFSKKIVEKHDKEFDEEKWFRQLDSSHTKEDRKIKARETHTRNLQIRWARNCPSCKANVGEKCIGAYGRLMQRSTHLERR